MKSIKTIFASLAFVLIGSLTNAQNSYSGYNLDFHDGYTGWIGRCGTGSVTSSANNPNWNFTTVLPNPSVTPGYSPALFEINSNTTATDSRTTSHPIRKIPEGYTNSTRINNDNSSDGSIAELQYTMEIDESNSLLTFNYAIVMEAPGHTRYENPAFQIEVIEYNQRNNNTPGVGRIDNCAKFEQVGSNNLPTLYPGVWFSGNSGYESIVWCEWQKIVINLVSYIGERVTVRVRLDDCTYSAHFAYGYFVASASEPTIDVAGCAGEGNIITSAVAPEGFASYEWFKINANSTSQTAIANDYASAQILGNEQEFFITEDMMNGTTTQYFAVKLVSPTTQDSIPQCEAFIRTKVEDMRPNLEAATYIPVNPLNARDEVGFKFSQVMPRTEAFPLIWQAVAFGDGDSVAFTKNNAGVWEIDPATPLTTKTRIVTDNNGSVDTIYHEYLPGNYDAIRYAQSSTIVGAGETATYCERNKTIPVYVAERPSLTIVGADTVCFGARDTLIASSPNNAADVVANYVYNWYNSIDDTAQAPVYIGEQYIIDNIQQTNTYVCKVVDAVNNYFRIGYFTVTIQAFPDLTLTGDTMLCLGQNADISASDATGNTVALQWTFQDPAGNLVITNPQTNPVLQFTPTRDTTVFLIAKTSAGCVNYDSIHIYVTIPKVESNVSKICPGDAVVLTGSGQHMVDYSFVATPTDASLTENVRSANPVTVSPQETTTYTMSGYGESGCHADVSIVVTVIPYPTATISYSPSYVDTDEPVLAITDASPYGASSVWTFSDGGTSDARTLNYEFHNLTSDSVGIHLVTYNELGCQDETSVNVPIELFAVWLPTGFTPNGDGNNDYFFFITNNKLEDVVFEVFDRWGTKMYSFEEKDYGTLVAGVDPISAFGWDGKYNGNYVQNGTYVWRLSYRREGSTRVYDRQGVIAVVK
ncbi:MAG: gliding motility-associated C-terminal domain-containing protein [Bacteroidales bacterium]|nr:gliding motility-associated C-terminal domain-containing protein [Bacteroidales bacterium]